MGYLYKRGNVWWAKWYADGCSRRESTGTEKWEDARRFLKDREGRAARGELVTPRVDRIGYEEAAKDLREHYETTGARELKEASRRLAHLDRFFKGMRLARIGPADATKYVAHRQAEEAANGTINRELALLKRMLRLAYENGKLLRLPVIRLLKESEPRQGFFEREQYEAVRRRLPPDHQAAVAIAYAFGWRMQSEVLTLERRHLDLEAGTLRLDPGTTKNDDGRLVYLPPDLRASLAAQVDRVRVLERETGRIIPWLFPYLSGHLRGQRIRDFIGRWRTACKRAGCPGKFRHDFRRTAVRNMVNAGIPERVAMTVTGHKTRCVFDRYHIVSPGDLREVARKLAGTISGTSGGVRQEAARASG